MWKIQVLFYVALVYEQLISKTRKKIFNLPEINYFHKKSSRHTANSSRLSPMNHCFLGLKMMLSRFHLAVSSHSKALSQHHTLSSHLFIV